MASSSKPSACSGGLRNLGFLLIEGKLNKFETMTSAARASEPHRGECPAPTGKRHPSGLSVTDAPSRTVVGEPYSLN